MRARRSHANRAVAGTQARPCHRARRPLDLYNFHRREANNTVANIKSQKKRNLTNEKARLRNKAVKSSLKTAVRRFNAAAEAGDSEQATALARDASRKLDKAVSKGVIHRNQAANRKSAIAKKASAL